jgi:hypothetical protein
MFLLLDIMFNYFNWAVEPTPNSVKKMKRRSGENEKTSTR